MKRAATALAIWSVAAVPALATSFCDGIEALQSAATERQAGAAFPDALTMQLPDGTIASCDYALELGTGWAVHCAWGFGYRAPEASDVFAGVLEGMTACYGPQIAADTAVNHPDSFDLRQFAVDEGTASVSLKDKGALQETFVFIRVSARPGI